MVLVNIFFLNKKYFRQINALKQDILNWEVGSSF